MTDAQLMKSSRWSRKMISARKSTVQTREVLEEVWNITLQEVEKLWLQGPLSEQEVRSLCGPLFVASPRFGLKQSDKTRPIDDMSISLVNSSFSPSYKLELDGVDGIAVLARTFVECVKPCRTVTFAMKDGSKLEGVLHPSLDFHEARSLVGRTLDLEAAYKQLLVKESSLWSSVLMVRDPELQPHYFISHVLPFGASASVYAFNRLSRAVYLIGTRLFGLVWSCYFDDFTQFDLECMGNSAQDTAGGLLTLVGWKFSTKESKRAAMAAAFSVLGVVVDLSSASNGSIMIKNKENRVRQITMEINSILAEGTFSVASASALRGRLQFAESQTFGRAVALHMQTCHQRAAGNAQGSFISDGMKSEMEWARSFMMEDCPRVLKADMPERKFLIFTDASLEGENLIAGIGMVALKLESSAVTHKSFFSECLPESVLENMQKETPKVIAALELLAAVLALETLKDVLSGSRVFLFIDNEAARANLISMSSPVAEHAKLLRRAWKIIREKSLFLWISRVPSASNIADEPSRFVVEDLLRLGFTRVHPKW